MAQFDKGRDRRPWIAKSHARTSGSVQHPCGHYDDYAKGSFDVNDFTTRPLLAVLSSKATAIQWVPAIKDLNFLPDRCRMTP
ncbi:hypothetical protein [Aromatoleum buckelii]|uniref:Uncharacterized protein n=1 Tax=Aromatoleum buckelii TaxID=200254 RepID=A0ABX1N838_9RHOO|nr:hypothetical protein [Aromatoleum buckelii]